MDWTSLNPRSTDCVSARYLWDYSSPRMTTLTDPGEEWAVALKPGDTHEKKTIVHYNACIISIR